MPTAQTSFNTQSTSSVSGPLTAATFANPIVAQQQQLQQQQQQQQLQQQPQLQPLLQLLFERLSCLRINIFFFLKKWSAIFLGWRSEKSIQHIFWFQCNGWIPATGHGSTNAQPVWHVCKYGQHAKYVWHAHYDHATAVYATSAPTAAIPIIIIINVFLWSMSWWMLYFPAQLIVHWLRWPSIGGFFFLIRYCVLCSFMLEYNWSKLLR